MTIPDAPPPPAPIPPRRNPPPGACDAHVHMLAGPDDFPLWDGRAENPAPGIDFDGWLDRFRAHLATLGLSRAVIVHSIFYGTDNSVTAETLRRLGPAVRGVGLLPDGATPAQVAEFAAQGMTAVRLNHVHGGVLSWDGARAMATALADRGLHIQMLCHADRHLDAIAADIRALPVPLVLDHCAWPSAGLAPDGPGLDTLCALLSEGHAWVKLSGLYRFCNPPYDAADPLVARLLAANPDQCLWGSDWPHIMLGGAHMPRAAHLLDAFDRVASNTDRRKVLADNPADLYGFDPPA